MTTINTGQDTKERLLASLTRAKDTADTTPAYKGVRIPDCSTCHHRTITLAQLSGLWGYSVQKIYSFIEKGMPYHNGEYYGRTGRQGTNGITQRFVCLDEVELWAVKNRKIFNNYGWRGYKRQPNAINGRYLPATWKPRINYKGSFVEHAPVITDYHGLFDSPRIIDDN